MWPSTDRIRAGALVLVLAGPASTVAAQEAALRVRESTFNKLAAATPIHITRSFTVWAPAFWSPLWPYDCDATADITGVTFDIKPSGVNVQAHVSTTICGVSAPAATLTTTATVSYDPTARTIRVVTGNTTLRPQVSAFGVTVPLPVTIDIGPALTVPPISVHTAAFVVETPARRRTFRLTGQDVAFSLKDGFIELSGDVLFW
jgi:hypothetical protein